MKKIIFGISILFIAVIVGSCKSKDPAILKVFVRSSSNQLMNGAKVVIIGDQQSNPATLDFVDTSYTNSSGFTVVDMDQYFDVSGPDNTTGYFDIVVKHNTKTAVGYTRCRVHTTSVETIYLPN
jgi:rRNA maturation protein Rpf1